jgi:glutamate synthase domain-containing protein 3
VGIATQEKGLRERYAGKPEMVINYFREVAEEARTILAGLGFRSLDEIIGRTDLLRERDVKSAKGVKLDLRALFYEADNTRPRKFMAFRATQSTTESDKQNPQLSEQILLHSCRAVQNAKPLRLSYRIKNTDRAIGANLAGEIAARYGDEGLPDATIDLHFQGSAGQSFGAFVIAGMRLMLTGEANDYVGKGMSGGTIVICPLKEARFDWAANTIMGNTVLYGATGGTLFAAGQAGERFAVRNSGATAVIEGAGEHGCEYMTAGTVVILGEVGRNFAAGMTGGIAYVLDVNNTLSARCNQELVQLEVLNQESDARLVHSLIEQHYDLTGSHKARDLLWNWEIFKHQFWKVITQGARAVKQRAKMESLHPVPSEGKRVIAVAE